MDASWQFSWTLFTRALVTGALAASLCAGSWLLLGGDVPPPAPIASGSVALFATTWAATHSRARGVFVLLICLVSTLVVATMLVSFWIVWGMPFLLIVVLFLLIRAWMKYEGFV